MINIYFHEKNISFHENNSLERSYEKSKGYLSAA